MPLFSVLFYLFSFFCVYIHLNTILIVNNTPTLKNAPGLFAKNNVKLICMRSRLLHGLTQPFDMGATLRKEFAPTGANSLT